METELKKSVILAALESVTLLDLVEVTGIGFDVEGPRKTLAIAWKLDGKEQLKLIAERENIATAAIIAEAVKGIVNVITGKAKAVDETAKQLPKANEKAEMAPKTEKKVSKKGKKSK